MSTQTHCIVKLLYKGMLGFGNLRECCSFDSCDLHWWKNSVSELILLSLLALAQWRAVLLP